MVFIDTHNAVSPNLIAFQLSQFLQTTNSSCTVTEAMKCLRWEHAFDPWHLLDLLGQISNSCIIIIDDLYSLTAPYQSKDIRSHGSTPTWTMDPLMAQVGVSVRYLCSETDCSFLLLDVRQVSESSLRKVTPLRYPYEEAVDVILCCSSPGNDYETIVLELGGGDPSMSSLPSSISLRL